MTHRITLERLVELVEGDRELVQLLIREEILVARPEGFGADDVDQVLATRTLVRELEVNLAGVEIILRLRRELADARRRLAELEDDSE